jgi:WhiB family transcriptional regulator, redox-sensing transcriptional regulator
MIEMDPVFEQVTIANWRDLARCVGRSDLFFPPPAERPQARDARERIAKALCANCLVKTECRDFARTNHEYGFWGGENEEQRVDAGYNLPAPVGIRRIRGRQSDPAA